MAALSINLSGQGVGSLEELTKLITGEGFDPIQAERIAKDVLASKPGATPAGKTTMSSGTSSKDYPPELVAQYEADVEAARRAAGDVTAFIHGAFDSIDGLSTEHRTALQQLASGQKQVAEADAAVREQELARFANLTKQFGMTGILTDQLGRWDSANQQVQQMKPVVDHLMAINPLANPVKWLFAQAQLASAVPQLNAAVNQRDSARQEIGTLQQQIKEQISMTPAITAKSITKELLGKTAAAEATAAIASAKVKEGAVTMRMQMLNEALSAARVNAFNSMEGMRAAAVRMNFATDNTVDAEKQFDLDRANAVRTLYGLSELKSHLEYKAQPQKVKDLISNMVPGQTSTAEAMHFIEVTGAYGPLQVKSPGMYRQVMEITALADAMVKAEPLDVNDKRKPQEKFYDAVEKLAAQWKKEQSTGNMLLVSKENPYRMRADEYAKADKLKDSPFSQYILTGAPLPASVDEREIILHALGRMNTVAPDQVAQELAQFFAEGGKFQHETRTLSALGLLPVRVGTDTKYEVSLKGLDLRGASIAHFFEPSKADVINLADPVQTKHLLTLLKAKQMIGGQGGAAGLVPSLF